jgi:Ser/Thr protein kinase RdoA (MazF antagonist)
VASVRHGADESARVRVTTVPTVPHSRLLKWWRDDAADPDRPSLEYPDVQRLIAEIDGGSRGTDLGGTMSLNARLEPNGLVLRVHQPFVSRPRLLAVQEVRRRLAQEGLLVALPVSIRNASVFPCGRRWAELEDYIAHQRLKPSLDSYKWMFDEMGTLHRALARLDLTVPRPLIATYSPPGSLRRWLSVTTPAVAHDAQASDAARLLRSLVGKLSVRWVPARGLPNQLVHGDVRLSNVCSTPEGKTLYLDFGFLALRPRIHDLAYSLAFAVLALGGHRQPETFSWHIVMELCTEYERAAGYRLTVVERKALAPFIAAVPLYFAALAGFSREPARQLQTAMPFVRLSEWLLKHPEAVT